MRIIPVTLAACVLFLAGSGAQSIQQPPAQAPTFRSGVDLLTLPVSVIDSAGRPVTDLVPADFVVSVEGRARKVLFARFTGTPPPAAPSPSPSVAAPAAAIENTATAGGRVILFVVDRESIRPGASQAMLEASTGILDGLTPADAAGIFTPPSGGMSPTRDHARVREELRRLTGTQPSSALARRDRLLTWDEALAVERGDRLTTARIVERECYNTPPSQTRPPERCPEELALQAREMLFAGRGHVRTLMASLGQTLEALVSIRGPKYVVMLSGGQAFDQELLPEYTRFARDAAAAGITLHAVHLDQPDADAADRRVQGSAFGGREMSAGLTTMTGMTGGAYYAGVGRAAGVFERIRTEIGNDYLLAIETLPADADGKLRDVAVQVRRPNVTVRARKQVLLAPAKAEPATARLLALLNQPTDVAGLPLAVSSYTTRGEENDTLRVLLSVEVGHRQALGAAAWAFAVFDGDRVMKEGRQELADEGGRRAITTSLQLRPGRYRVRVGAMDPDGRAGVIDTSLTVGLRAAGKLQVSDVIIGTSIADRMQPQSRIRRGLPLVALVEAVSADIALLEQTRLALEIFPVDSSEAVQRVLMASRSGVSAAVLLSEAQIDTASLPVGRYLVSATPLVNGQPAGRVSRVLEVVDDGR